MAVKKAKIKLCREDKILYTFVTVLMILFILVIVYPLVFIVSSSFSSNSAITSGKVMLWPVQFTTVGYKVVFGNRNVWIGFYNTMIYTVVGTAINLVMTTLVAYPLSRRNLQGRGIYTGLFLFTMWFSGGVIPQYLLLVNLHMINTRWALLLPGAISVYNMIIMRTFFQNSIPADLQEAATLDGCSDFRYLIQIVLPLSKAVMSVLLLYYAVAHWNSYYNALLYLRDRSLQPLQLFLREILAANSNLASESSIGLGASAQEAAQNAGETVRYSMIVIASLPILVLYPAIQKYFEKGVMIGSVKG